MRTRSAIAAGKAVQRLSALRGGGSALPGLLVERLDHAFLRDSLSQLPLGVVVIVGTNGKTTTTKMVSQLLGCGGLRVFTNRTGSNLTRGVTSALLEAVRGRGTLDYDIAVLELDEAHAARLVRQIPPRYCLVLNVMRDQLDRFGEIDHTARLLESVAQAATEGVVLNRDDARVARIAASVSEGVEVGFFGTSQDLRSIFVSDDELYGPPDQTVAPAARTVPTRDVQLSSYAGSTATFVVGGEQYTADLKVGGLYNFVNAAAALALCRLVPDSTASTDELVKALESVTPAFGRGETVTVDGAQVELLLVKNPSGFRLALLSLDLETTDVMIAVNDDHADGRDVSWLWDVDFSRLHDGGVQMVSGVRAYEMALRLQYDEVHVAAVEPGLRTALDRFVTASTRPKRIFCTYTAMMSLRRVLARYTQLERV